MVFLKARALAAATEAVLMTGGWKSPMGLMPVWQRKPRAATKGYPFFKPPD